MSRRKPDMKGILDPAQPRVGRRGHMRTFNVGAAVLLTVATLGAFFYGVVHLGDLVVAYPALKPVQPILFPAIAVAMILAILPLLFYISFQDDFGELSPFLPTHYAFLARKTFAAILANDFKVSAKDL